VKDGVPVIEEEGRLGVGDTAHDARLDDAGGHPGLVAEQVEDLQADGLA